MELINKFVTDVTKTEQHFHTARMTQTVGHMVFECWDQLLFEQFLNSLNNKLQSGMSFLQNFFLELEL